MLEPLEPQLFDEVEEALKDVIDPELGVNVVDLGLIYDIGREADSSRVVISMTLTTAECPLQDNISEQTADALQGLIDDHAIAWVWVPAWTPARITEDGREMMRAIGFNV